MLIIKMLKKLNLFLKENFLETIILPEEISTDLLSEKLLKNNNNKIYKIILANYILPKALELGRTALDFIGIAQTQNSKLLAFSEKQIITNKKIKCDVEKKLLDFLLFSTCVSKTVDDNLLRCINFEDIFESAEEFSKEIDEKSSDNLLYLTVMWRLGTVAATNGLFKQAKYFFKQCLPRLSLKLPPVNISILLFDTINSYFKSDLILDTKILANVIQLILSGRKDTPEYSRFLKEMLFYLFNFEQIFHDDLYLKMTFVDMFTICRPILIKIYNSTLPVYEIVNSYFENLFDINKIEEQLQLNQNDNYQKLLTPLVLLSLFKQKGSLPKTLEPKIALIVLAAFQHLLIKISQPIKNNKDIFFHQDYQLFMRHFNLLIDTSLYLGLSYDAMIKETIWTSLKTIMTLISDNYPVDNVLTLKPKEIRVIFHLARLYKQATTQWLQDFVESPTDDKIENINSLLVMVSYFFGVFWAVPTKNFQVFREKLHSWEEHTIFEKIIVDWSEKIKKLNALEEKKFVKLKSLLTLTSVRLSYILMFYSQASSLLAKIEQINYFIENFEQALLSNVNPVKIIVNSMLIVFDDFCNVIYNIHEKLNVEFIINTAINFLKNKENFENGIEEANEFKRKLVKFLLALTGRYFFIDLFDEGLVLLLYLFPLLYSQFKEGSESKQIYEKIKEKYFHELYRYVPGLDTKLLPLFNLTIKEKDYSFSALLFSQMYSGITINAENFEQTQHMLGQFLPQVVSTDLRDMQEWLSAYVLVLYDAVQYYQKDFNERLYFTFFLLQQYSKFGGKDLSKFQNLAVDAYQEIKNRANIFDNIEYIDYLTTYLRNCCEVMKGHSKFSTIIDEINSVYQKVFAIFIEERNSELSTSLITLLKRNGRLIKDSPVIKGKWIKTLDEMSAEFKKTFLQLPQDIKPIVQLNANVDTVISQVPVESAANNNNNTKTKKNKKKKHSSQQTTNSMQASTAVQVVGFLSDRKRYFVGKEVMEEQGNQEIIKFQPCLDKQAPDVVKLSRYQPFTYLRFKAAMLNKNRIARDHGQEGYKKLKGTTNVWELKILTSDKRLIGELDEQNPIRSLFLHKIS